MSGLLSLYNCSLVIWLMFLGWKQSTENQGSRLIRRLAGEVAWEYQKKELRPSV